MSLMQAYNSVLKSVIICVSETYSDHSDDNQLALPGYSSN